MLLGSFNRMVRKGYRLGSHDLKAFETSLEGLCCVMDTVSSSPYFSWMPPRNTSKNHFGTAEPQWPDSLGQQETIPTRKPKEIDGTGSTEEGSRSEFRGFWILELQIAPVSHLT